VTEVAGAVAVITGGGSGIGRAISVALVDAGATVAIADIELSTAERTAAEIGAHAFAVDVSDEASVLALAADVVSRFGRVDILVNNAGVASVSPLEEMTDADWQWMLGVNLYGLIHTVRAFLPHLPRGGHILATGSMAGLSPDSGMGGYGVSKFAVTAYAEVLAAELEPRGIGVTLLAPGPVHTRLGSSSRNRPADSRGGLHDADLGAGDGGGMRWLEPEEVGAIAVRAIVEGSRYAITHHDWLPVVEARHRAIEAAFTPPTPPRDR